MAWPAAIKISLEELSTASSLQYSCYCGSHRSLMCQTTAWTRRSEIIDVAGVDPYQRCGGVICHPILSHGHGQLVLNCYPILSHGHGQLVHNFGSADIDQTLDQTIRIERATAHLRSPSKRQVFPEPHDTSSMTCIAAY